MAWSFGDSFDLYAAPADMLNGYWDSAASTTVQNLTFVAGRFSGSQACSWSSASNAVLNKTSGVNDAVHHFVVSFRQTAAISGTTLGLSIELFDGATAQCSIVFRSDGAILLTSGIFSGTVLATYAAAFPVTNTWYAFECEVVINNTTGSFSVRKNGNTVNDFTLGSLNTRGGTANNYANKILVGQGAGVNLQQFDDFFWQSGAATGAWLGDIRCYARMPASDVQTQFSRSPTALPLTPFSSVGPTAVTANLARYTPFTPAFNGSVVTVGINFTVASTANFKCAVYSNSAGVPATVLGSATPISAPGIGVATFTFGTPVAVTAGTQYWIAVDPDATSGQHSSSSGTAGCSWNSATYASFPTNSPSVSTGSNPIYVVVGVSSTINYPWISEAQQDGLTSYVYDSNPGDADFYGIGSIASTPATVIATTTRAYMQKSDAGTRTAAVQLKSGATTVASPTLVLTTSGFQWAWRTDLVDPATGVAWTPAAVNNAQIGPRTVA